MNIVRLEEIESTNNFAKANIDVFEDKTAIITKRQISGRGRLNRTWVDLGDSNLFLSIVLKPSDTFNEIYPNITQYLSVCVCKTIEKYNLKPQIKWPNDVLINGAKIAGILSETVMQGNKLKGIVLGIGVNLNSTKEKLENIPDKVATSLNIEVGKDINLKEFLDNLLDEFFKNYDKFLQTGFSLIKEDYINRNCFLNKNLEVKVFNSIKKGLAKRLTDKGELVLTDKNDKEMVLTIGDIL